MQGHGNLALGDTPRPVRGIRHRLEEEPETRPVLAKELLFAAQGLAEVPVGGGLARKVERVERVVLQAEFKNLAHTTKSAVLLWYGRLHRRPRVKGWALRPVKQSHNNRGGWPVL